MDVCPAPMPAFRGASTSGKNPDQHSQAWEVPSQGPSSLQTAAVQNVLGGQVVEASRAGTVSRFVCLCLNE